MLLAFQSNCARSWNNTANRERGGGGLVPTMEIKNELGTGRPRSDAGSNIF
jgi:hypothetical protein